MLGKKILAAVTSVGVTSAMLLLGTAATSSATVIAPPPDPAPNPDLAGCGIPITLVLDASGSISGSGSPSERDQVKAAATAFINGLDNSKSSARILQFSTTSEELSSRLPIQGDDKNALNTAIATKYYTGIGGGWTNWQMALWQTGQEAPPLQNGLVVFVTDGDPNTVGGFEGKSITTDDSNAGRDAAADASIQYANALKAAGNRVLAVGVGLIGASSQTRLTKISGTDVQTEIAPTESINDFDVLIPKDFANLTSALKNVAASLCGGSITLTKYTDKASPGTYTPAADWTLGAEIKNAEYGTDFTWLKPANNTGQAATGTTGDDGAVQFQVNPKPTWLETSPSVRISEKLKPSTKPRADFGYRCTFNAGLNPRVPQQGDLQVQGDEAFFEIQNLKADQSVSCDIYNKQLNPGIKVVKTASATEVETDSTVVYTYDVTNTGDTPLSNVAVVDDLCSPVTYKSGDDGDKLLQVGEVWKYECSKTLTATETNTATATGKDETGKTVENTAQATVTVKPKPTPNPTVSPEVVKQVCPIDPTLHKPQAKKVGNRVMTDKIKTKKSSCVLLKPVVLCRPLNTTAAGETAFCDTKVTKKGRITVKTKGYDAVKVSVVVRAKPKPGFSDRWKPSTWRKSWTLR